MVVHAASAPWSEVMETAFVPEWPGWCGCQVHWFSPAQARVIQLEGAVAVDCSKDGLGIRLGAAASGASRSGERRAARRREEA